MGGTVTLSLKRYEQRLAMAITGGVLVLLSLLPLLWPAVEFIFRDPGGLWSGLLTLGTSRNWLLLARSLGLSLAVTLGALGVGVPLGLLLGRFDLVGRRYLLGLQAVPMFLPPFLLALGWFYLFGRKGLLGGELSAGLLFSAAGFVAILSLAFAPLAASLVTLGLWNLDPTLEEAARVVARPGRVALRILLPAMWPSITLAAILIFSLALSEMGVPMFLRIDVYPAAVFARLGGIDYNPGEAFLLALPLIPLAIMLLAMERWLFRDRSFAILGMRHQDREPMQLRRWRWPVSLTAWGLVVLSLAPLASLVIRGVRDQGFIELPNWIGSSLYNSLLSSLGAATMLLGIAVILGHASARRLRGAKFYEVIALQAFFTPAVLLGVGLIVLVEPARYWIYLSESGHHHAGLHGPLCGGGNEDVGGGGVPESALSGNGGRLPGRELCAKISAYRHTPQLARHWRRLAADCGISACVTWKLRCSSIPRDLNLNP